jgi:hypothetical protein
MRVDPPFKPLPPEPATLLTEGRLREAIQVLRESQGIGHRRARDWVRWHIAQDPMLGVQLETQRRRARNRRLSWLLACALLAGAATYYFVYLPR